MIVAGDIGGTKTHIALFDWRKDRVEPVRLESFHQCRLHLVGGHAHRISRPADTSDAHRRISQRKSDDAELEPESRTKEPLKIDAACFGIAGPVIQNRCQTTNLPWVVDGATLATRFDIPKVKLLNDLEAMAYGILLLRPDEVEILNAALHHRTTRRSL
jgi:Glucokinase